MDGGLKVQALTPLPHTVDGNDAVPRRAAVVVTKSVVASAYAVLSESRSVDGASKQSRRFVAASHSMRRSSERSAMPFNFESPTQSTRQFASRPRAVPQERTTA